ncbi:hypothetical protein H257_02312 [Aphanomyces astaci]|uniref:Vms1-associating treble clef domain-containing protein n=1 Tax=Aphanomyces astaci TaxID=112090 RepID=W4H1D4_APHAT|nr:hypothetical protein H257_02312 [Aphanomyces astaci]ETV85712.1 hypothetical protein H257_02312 [Aphanomyces astaci]|eukprot:XP_009824184.1 hypothetical protein H257_02312 [Aphanomyces astaci]
MIMTVRGAVAASAIKPGGILVHQRVLQKETTVVDMDIAAEDLMELREHPAEKGNLVLSNETRAYRELERLSLVQSNCVVDIHGRDERDVVRLKRMAEQLDLHILASTSLNDTTTSTDVSALAHQLVLDLQYGMDNTTIQASVIYQRTSLSPANPTILRAIAQAQQVTNAPVYFSFDSDPSASYPTDRLIYLLHWRSCTNMIHMAGNLRRVVLCHCDLWWRHPAALEHVATTTNVWLSFDLVGLSAVSDHLPFLASSSNAVCVPRDFEIAQCVQVLLTIHFNHVLISSTVTQTIQYHRNGGGGMLHALSSSFQTKLFHGRRGTAAQHQQLWHTITHHNPLLLLQGYVKPPPSVIPKDFIPCSICRLEFEPVVGEYFTKFEFVYCSTKCLRRHRVAGFGPVDQVQ